MKKDLDWHGMFGVPRSEGTDEGPRRGWGCTPDPFRQGVALPSADTSPRKAYLELTTGCNLSCRMCIRGSWDSRGGTMSPETFRAVLDQLRDLPGPPVINFSGYGEPMMHPLFLRFVAEAKEAGLFVEVVTNGTLLDEATAGRLIDLELDRIIVSVDGVTAASSLMLHARPFREVKAALRTLHHLRLSRKAIRPDVGILFVATKRNIHELPELASLSYVLGFSGILVTNVIPHTAELAEDTLYERPGTAPRAGRPSAASPCVDLPLMDARSPASAVIERLRSTGTYLRNRGADFVGAGPRCRFVTEGRFAVRWDGSVSPCLSLLHSHGYYFRGKPRRVRCYHVGNVHDAPVEAIWTGEEYSAFRDRVRRFDFSPCIDCGGCDLRETNEEDCTAGPFPRCGECLWAAGLVQCP